MNDCVFPKCADSLKIIYEGCYAGFYECDFCENLIGEEEIKYSKEGNKYVVNLRQRQSSNRRSR